MESPLYAFMSLGAVLFLIGLGLLYSRVQSLMRAEKRVLLVENVGIGMLIVCLLFIAFATVMIPLQSFDKELHCDISIWSCILLYTTNKLFLYVYLIEKSHIINCALSKFEKRSESKLYMCNIVSVSLWCVLLVLMILYRKSSVDSDGICHIGLTHVASVSVLVFDTLYRIYLMSLFVWPLWKFANESDVVMAMAKKNLFGAVVSTLCSFFNLLSVVFANGNERGHICLLYCMIDVFVNVVIMNWLLTSHRDKPLQSVSKMLLAMKLDSVVTVTHNVTNLKLYKDSVISSSSACEVRSPLPSCLAQTSSTPRMQSNQRVKFADTISYSDNPELPRPLPRGNGPVASMASPALEAGKDCPNMVPIRRDSPRHVVGAIPVSYHVPGPALQEGHALMPSSLSSSCESEEDPTKYRLK